MPITLYYSPQSNATRIYASLEELGVPYERITVNRQAGEQRRPEFLAMNPNGAVPTVVIDGTAMFESVAIQIALGERFGVERGLWPALGSPEHLQALTWLVWGQVNLTASLWHYLANSSIYVPEALHHPKQAEQALKDVHHQLGILNAHLSDRESITGDRFTLADLDLACVLGWSLTFAKVDLASYPKIAAWLGRASGRPGLRAAMSPA